MIFKIGQRRLFNADPAGQRLLSPVILLAQHNVEAAIFLPATACGLLATAVLNINNLRDIDSDRQNGKNTLAVRLGPVLVTVPQSPFCLYDKSQP